jgi:pyruvate ferredoxin oxidoreductase gamma subunit
MFLDKIRIHGRGGQGGRLAAKMLALAAFLEGKDVQAFSLYGSERRGAPVAAFCRIAKKGEKILERGYIEDPDYVIVLDESLLDLVDIAKGTHKKSVIIVNSNKEPKELKLKTKGTIATVNAKKIALEELKKPIYNTTMLGAFVKKTRVVKLESVLKALKEGLKRYGPAVVEANSKAVKRAFKEVS